MSAHPKPVTALATTVYVDAAGLWHAKVPVERRRDGSVRRRHFKRKTATDLRAAIAAAGLRANVEWPEEPEPAVGPAPAADSVDGRLTLAGWLERFLDERLPLAGRAPKTIYGYRCHFQRHLLPTLGALPVADIDGTVLQRFFAGLAQTATPHTVVAVYRATRSAFADAIAAGEHPGPNPCASFRVQRPKEPEVEPYTLEEARRLLAAARERPNAVRWSIALSLGWRQSEVLGLKWIDVDLDAGNVRLRRGASRVVGRHGCGSKRANGRWACGYKQAARCPQRIGASGIVEHNLKTEATRRTVPLPRPLVDELRVHREQQALSRAAAGADWQERGYVFTDSVGAPTDPRRDWAAWKALIKAAGVADKRLHDARHTAATLLLAQGNDSRVVQKFFGWSEQSTANRYTHVVGALTQAAADSMEMLWAGS